jgi:hypothetical protein
MYTVGVLFGGYAWLKDYVGLPRWNGRPVVAHSENAAFLVSLPEHFYLGVWDAGNRFEGVIQKIRNELGQESLFSLALGRLSLKVESKFDPLFCRGSFFCFQ